MGIFPKKIWLDMAYVYQQPGHVNFSRRSVSCDCICCCTEMLWRLYLEPGGPGWVCSPVSDDLVGKTMGETPGNPWGFGHAKMVISRG